MMSTPDRPTSSGLQSPSGLLYLQNNGEITMLENQEKKNVNCSAMYLQHEENPLGLPEEGEAHQDELYNASSPGVSKSMAVQFVPQKSSTRQSTSRIWLTSRYCSIPKDTTTSTSAGAKTAQQCQCQAVDISSAVDTPNTKPKTSGEGGPPESSG